MKPTRPILLFLTAIFLSSCATPFYQVYKVAPLNAEFQKSDLIKFEDPYCVVSYNLWSQGGDIGFLFTNKTDENIFIELDQTFFVLNGIAHNYYLNRVYTTSETSAASFAQSSGFSRTSSDMVQSGNRTISRGVVKATGYSVSFAEEKVVCIPPHTSKRIAEYSISDNLYRNCDLFKYPTKKQITTATFTRSNSPVVFSNRITYRPGTGEAMQMNNEFFVAEVTNLPEAEAVELTRAEFCDQKALSAREVVSGSAPDRFYIKYQKTVDYLKH
ncbi:MAG: hypothetical protein JNJ75_05830 [Cyclobacteriaceae bacterium]|nr:hypothetical protein [Cyclobacteriaceae bacterium]